MPNKARLDKEAREIVWRVSEYFRKQLNSNTADYVEKTVSACGVSRATVYRIRKEKEEPGSGKSRNKKPVTVYDEERYLIRKALYEFQQEEGCPPTLEQLRLRLQSSMEFKGDERMLKKMLRRQGFFLKKIEQPAVKQEPEESQESMEINQEEEAPSEDRLSQPATPNEEERKTLESDNTNQLTRKPAEQKIHVTPIALVTQCGGLVAQKVLVNQRATNPTTASPQKPAESPKLPANHSAALHRKSLIGQKTLVSSLGQKALMNPKAQMYQIVGVGKGGQVILKPQSQQVRLVQKATTILKVNQPRLQG